MKSTLLHVKRFAQITDAQIEFGDLTVLVGPQATGKSLMLQFLKLALDRPVISRSLWRTGFPRFREQHQLAATFLGEGYEKCFNSQTRASLGTKNILRQEGRSSGRKPRVFFIPAQRVVSMANGWPKSFAEYGPGDPFVVREFSQQIFEAFGRGLGKDGAPLFPNPDRLKAPIRKSIEQSIFHGGSLVLRQDGARKQLTVRYSRRARSLNRSTVSGRLQSKGDVSLPFLEWSAGQREFTPLLLGLYQLLPGGKVSKHPDYRWAVIEEPEMGLHPKGINSVMLLVFELLYRGYKVAISTHAPYVLELVWAIQRLRESRIPKKKRAALLLKALDNPGTALKKVAATLLKKRIKVYALTFGKNGKYSCTDISSLDPSDENEQISGWGGVSSLSGLVSEAVAKGAR